MRNFKWFRPVVIILLLISCGKSLPDLEGIDQSQWRNDRNGCNNYRSTMEVAIRKEKDKLLALDEMQIVKLLGRPDRNELFKRNQKFFLYFIEPAKDCNHDSTQSPKKLVIRFNAMGLAKEIAIE